MVVDGGPDLRGGSVADQFSIFRDAHDRFRSAVVNEPRGSDVVVGALLVPSADPSCAAGVIFFNNIGVLGMCGHGTIGLVVTLAFLGRIGPGTHRIETPVGVVTTTLRDDGRVSVENVRSHRVAKDVSIEVDGLGTVTGDVAWGGNWFFLAEHRGIPIALRNAAELTSIASRIRAAVNAQGHPLVDHVELFCPANAAGVQSRNFVLCPGGAYDRSPCGTGTSAKLACLYADGKLREGDVWRQESITGSVFEGTVRAVEGGVMPTISGSAHVTAEATLILDDRDPLRDGLRPAEGESAA